MHRIAKLFLFITLLLSSLAAKADLGGFYYKTVKYEAVVHKNNVWDVKETFTLNFTEPRHGFYRFIPLRFQINHDLSSEKGKEDVKLFTYTPSIDNVEVQGGPVHDQYEENYNWVIQIGDESETVTGVHTYTITYTFTYPDDRLDDRDYLVHTILGADFNENIEHFEFNIEFEKPLPQLALDNLQWYSGAFGNETNIIPIEYEATASNIYGTCDNVQPNHAITIYMPMNEGYYEGVEKDSNKWFYIWMGISLFLIVVIIIRAFTVYRGKMVVKTIEFYPPEGISSAEVGVIIDESVDNEDIASLITWFAHKGYLTMKDVDNGKLELHKVKGLPGNAPEYQKIFYDLLFGKSSTVRLDQIGERPQTMERIKDALEECFKGDRELTDIDWGFMLYFPLIITSTLALAVNIPYAFSTDELWIPGCLWALPAACGFSLRLSAAAKDWMKTPTRRIIGLVLRFIGMAIVAVIYCTFGIEYGAPMNEQMILGFFLINFIAVELAGRFTINTDYRVDLMGKLLGFKEFIETAEKSQLENLQMEDAQYFYRVLPYAMVFDLADKWADRFKDIKIDRPDWYDTNISDAMFTHRLLSSVNDSVRSSVASISHDSSSSSSGGGFSGGGGGGGGGGSW